MQHINPGVFAFVMVTGIVSTALDTDSSRAASLALLVVAWAGFVLLLVAYGWRLLRWRPWSVADLAGPPGFAFLTIAAASNVPASRVLAGGHLGVAAALMVLGAVTWLVPGYGVPLGLITARSRRPSLNQTGPGSSGWSGPSLSRSPQPGSPGYPRAWPWWYRRRCAGRSAGAVSVDRRARVGPVAGGAGGTEGPHSEVRGLHGAAAVSVLAGSKLLELPSGGGLVPRQVAVGVSVVLWSFCSWLIPLLLVLGVWRHVLRRVPLRYEAGLWSMVFPVGMDLADEAAAAGQDAAVHVAAKLTAGELG